MNTRQAITQWLRDADQIPGNKLVAALAVEHDNLLIALEACLGPLQDEQNRAAHTGHQTAASKAFIAARLAIAKAKGESTP